MGAKHSHEAKNVLNNSVDIDKKVPAIEDTEEETEAGLEERRRILEDCKELRKYADCHLHPEKPVAKEDPLGAACCRCYFDRPSAPQQETPEDVEERARIMYDCIALRSYAGYHLHPERPVITTDSTACGRNFFDRPSAPDQETKDEMQERSQVMDDVRMLKMYAKFHLHPELPVRTTDSTACGRNFFDRLSSPDQETLEEAEERHIVLKDAAHLEELAQIRLHDHILEKDYFHCHFAMDEDIDHHPEEFESPVDHEEHELIPTKLEEHGNLSRSPSAIIDFA